MGPPARRRSSARAAHRTPVLRAYYSVIYMATVAHLLAFPDARYIEQKDSAVTKAGQDIDKAVATIASVRSIVQQDLNSL